MKESHPVLSCAASMEWEKTLLAGEEEREWEAMSRAGRKIGAAVALDYREVSGSGGPRRVLVLAGKGHNAGDAIIAADELDRGGTVSGILVVFASGEDALRPLVRKAWHELRGRAGERVRGETFPAGEKVGGWLETTAGATEWDVCLDGLLGMQFRPPLRVPLDEVIRWANRRAHVRLRAAVDVPSGMGDACADEPFRADFTYMPGIPKRCVFETDPAVAGWTGRLRYLDLGFFENGEPDAERRLVTPGALRMLGGWRDPRRHKKGWGHLFIAGGSAALPGAILMSVLAALRSGVGLVTAFVPKSLVPAFAARAPEAMWVPMPESSGGGLAREGIELLRERREQATALVIGPGLGAEAGAHELAARAIAGMPCPVLLDADALRDAVLSGMDERKKGCAPVAVTPHAGEFERIAGRRFSEEGEEGLMAFCRKKGVVAALKGPPFTRITDGGTLYYSISGGPVLARGGSGDVLSGLAGGLMAEGGSEVLQALLRGVAWHGAAADALARARGARAVVATDLPAYLSEALRPGESGE